ncbi:FtsX-like permease family protein [Clostridium thermobutyricum]|uniref:Bacitracin export permease protein BceB n=1 Tax=Clostridium thermobutyricum DSM 4928 TaxID=1121339 RepID=A0A1V4SYN7_9CLOT|nr:FtsX-like permease family protein [Clostridium thermobutyricum]OPX49964.1 bacitracin export permease protein BceB [Clostridium thermobutyricum DSM 4928]
MYFKLAKQNVKKSFKSYIIYFFTLVFGVAIFYIFNSISSQSIMMNLSEEKKVVFDMVNTVMGYISIFIAFILGFLIVYSNNYLIKRRKKEFGVYLTLGMEKGTLSKIIFIETILIGLISLIIGLVLGVVLSQGLSIFTAYMFKVDLTKFCFIFSESAFKKTILCFIAIYIIVLIFNSIKINKIKIIDLLKGARKNETQTVKKVWVSVILFILSVVMIGSAYYMVIKMGISELEIKTLGISVLLGSVGTVLFFYSLTGFVLEVVKRRKSIYLKDLNMFVLRQISSKINTTFISISVICLMLFIAICTLSTGLGVNIAMNSNLKDLTRFDATIWNNDGKSIQSILNYNKAFISDYVESELPVTLYDSGVRYGDFLSKKAMENQNAYYPIATNQKIVVMNLSEYNAILKNLGEKEISLGKNEYTAIGDIDSLSKWANESLKSGKEIKINNETLKPANMKFKEIDIYDFLMKNNLLTFIVNDPVLNGLKPVNTKVNINLKKGVNIDKLKEFKINQKGFYMITKREVYANSEGIGLTYAYLGIYIGLIFIMASAIVLSIQQLTDSIDNKERYKVLKEIGVDEKMINKSLFKQIGIYFLLPISLAIIHSIVGIKVASKVVSMFGDINIVKNIIIAMIVIIVIYGGYFVITYLTAKRNIID